MKYKLKEEIAKQIKNKHLVEKLGMSNTYVSQLVHRKRTCPKHTAYAIASLYGVKIKDIFEEIGG